MDGLEHKVLQLEVATALPLFEILDKSGKLWELLAAVVEVVINGGKFAYVGGVQLQKGALFHYDVGNFWQA